ncbi:uncharacterized protein LOC111385546 [Olea europaea var. sylvestris]|uniref:uncharacterized protein LOC111385546 n=1 Tax=Olea europaea var. sylvestris TaxID=158386 RepID=UPI000C1D0CD9|nr:uncharacterized protein LOC111385546 [Olea europaea var. sylvestris]
MLIDRLTELVERQSQQIQQLIQQGERGEHQRAKFIQPQQRAKHFEAVGERFRKLNPPIFEDALDPTAAEDWLRTLENMFSARHWWDTMSSIEDVNTMTWDRFKELFRNKYFTAPVQVMKMNEFIQLRQGGMTVGEYIHKFEQLSRFTTHMINTDALKVERFLEGLRPELYTDGKCPRIDQGKALIAQPSCPRCGGQHTAACPIETRTCYIYGKVGHLARACPGNPNPIEQKKVPARVFTITRSDAEANPVVVTGKFSIFCIPALVLLDSGATHSFVSTEYLRRLGRTPDIHEVSYSVTIPSGDVQQTNLIVRACTILTENRELYANLIVLDMKDYDIILGMDWLSRYQATIDCKRKSVTFQLLGNRPFTCIGIEKGFRVPIISVLKAQRLLDRGCVGYLVSIMAMEAQHNPNLKNFQRYFLMIYLGYD